MTHPEPEPDIPPENDLHNLAMQIRYDLTAAQGKLTELMRQIGTLELENQPTRIYNLPGTYQPGRLRYLTDATRAVWDSTPPDQRRHATTLWLEGFTDNPAEINEHLDALTAAQVTPATPHG